MQRNDICVMGLVAVLCVNTLAACSDAARSTSPDPEDKGATNPQSELPVVPPSPITTIAHNVTTAEDSPVSFDSPALTDINTESVALVVKNFQPPAHGRVVMTDKGSFIYTPEANYNGADAFVYTVTDGRDHEAQGTVNINVTAMNDAPAAMADSASTPRNTNLLLAATQVLANDSDIDGDALAIATVTNGSKGTVTLNTDGSMTYAPRPNAIGTDSFTYTTRDAHGGESAAASIAVNIQPGWGTAESLESLFPGAITPVLISMTTDHAGGTSVFWTETGSGGLTELWTKQIDITSGEWVKAKRLSSLGAGVRAESPHVVVDKFGTTTVLWGEVAGGAYQMWLNRLESGVWGNPSNVLADVILGGFGQSGGGYNGSNTHLLADQREKGAICVVWDSGGHGGFPYMLAGSGFSPAKGWATFDGFSHSDTSAPLAWPTYQTAIDSNGDVTVVYAATYDIPNRQGEYAQVLRSAHFVNGKWLTTTDTFGNPVSEVKHVDGVASGKLGLNSAQFFPNFRNLAVDQNNVVTAIWSQSNMIYANRYDPKARLWGTALKISEGKVDGQGLPLTSVSTPGMVMDKLGNITAAWFEGSGSRQIWASRYEPQFGTWRKLQRISDKLPGYAGPHYEQPLLAVDDSGVVAAAWVQVDGVNQRVWSNRNENGEWIGEKLVYSSEPNTQYYLDKIQQHKNGAVTIIGRARAVSGVTTLWASTLEKETWTTKILATHPNSEAPIELTFNVRSLIEDGLGHMTLVFLVHGSTAVENKNWLVDFR